MLPIAAFPFVNEFSRDVHNHKIIYSNHYTVIIPRMPKIPVNVFVTCSKSPYYISRDKFVDKKT